MEFGLARQDSEGELQEVQGMERTGGSVSGEQKSFDEQFGMSV